MAKNQYLSKSQQGIVNRYYANQDSRIVAKLQELVSDLYLTSEEKAKTRKWETIVRELAKSNADPARVTKIVGAKDIKALAELIAAPKFSAAEKKPTPAAKSAILDTDDV